MSHIKKNNSTIDGFTLIEVLVSINLSFIVITIAIMSYLLIYRFVVSFSNDIEEKEFIYETLNKIETVIKSNNNVKFHFSSDSIYASSLSGNLLNIKYNSISLNDLYKIDEIEDLQIKFYLTGDDKKEIIWGKSYKHFTIQDPILSIPSKNIVSLSIQFKKQLKARIYRYYIPFLQTSVNRFKNMNE